MIVSHVHPHSPTPPFSATGKDLLNRLAFDGPTGAGTALAFERFDASKPLVISAGVDSLRQVSV